MPSPMRIFRSARRPSKRASQAPAPALGPSRLGLTSGSRQAVAGLSFNVEQKRAAMNTKQSSSESAAKQVARFIGRYEPAVAKLVRSARKTLCTRMPTAIEQVYDGYHFLALGFCTTERTSDCIVSLAVSPKGVALSFYHGVSLADPDGLLSGSGKQNRYVRLEDARTLSRPAIASLLDAAIAQAKTPLPVAGRGYTIIKSVAAKQRPRRAEAPRPGAKRRRGTAAKP